MKKEEIWKNIEGYEGLYQVSNFGRVRSLDRVSLMRNGYRRKIKGKILSQSIKNSGYYKITLSKNGILKTFLIHRLVAQAFIPNPNNLPLVNHKDENKLNNNVSNLEWVTDSENNSYGTLKERKQEKLQNPIVQLTVDGEFVNRFISIGEAARQTGFNRTRIGDAVRGETLISHDYCWCYEWQYERYFK